MKVVGWVWSGTGCRNWRRKICSQPPTHRDKETLAQPPRTTAVRVPSLTTPVPESLPASVAASDFCPGISAVRAAACNSTTIIPAASPAPSPSASSGSRSGSSPVTVLPHLPSKRVQPLRDHRGQQSGQVKGLTQCEHAAGEHTERCPASQDGPSVDPRLASRLRYFSMQELYSMMRDTPVARTPTH